MLSERAVCYRGKEYMYRAGSRSRETVTRNPGKVFLYGLSARHLPCRVMTPSLPSGCLFQGRALFR